MRIRRTSSIFYSIVCVFVFVRAADDRDRLKCRSIEGSKSCGQCIKSDPDCAWCIDPHSNITQRCDLKTAFTPELCASQYVYSPITELKIAFQHNLPLGSKQADGISTTQLEPQQVVIKLKHGDVLEVPFQYIHMVPVSGQEVIDFSIQTSEFRSLGLAIEFFIECNGKKISGRVCPGVKVDQIINFYAKVTLNECKAGGDIAVSIGVYGYNTVSGLFITPVCGCECEKLRNHERRAPMCTHSGSQICGACLCDEGRGGTNCECQLAQYAAANAEDLENRCRKDLNSLVCSGKGKCNCGECHCEAEYVRGKYCECDSTGCSVNIEGKLCSGQGECECGRCLCENGFSGEDCSCSTDQRPCEEGGQVCSDHGVCECGQCACHAGYTGARCNIEQKIEELPKSGVEMARNPTETNGKILPPVSDDEKEEQENSTATGASIFFKYNNIDFFGILSTIIVLLLGYFAF